MKIVASIFVLLLCNQIALSQTSYTFHGNGYWSISTNWNNNIIPPNPLPSGETIYISPQSGDSCVLNFTQTISQGAVLIISPGANFIVTGLIINPIKLKKKIEIDTTLAPPLDTIARMNMSYDNLGRLSLFSYSNTNSTGDTLNSFRFWYQYLLDDTLAYRTIRHTSYYSSSLSNKTDTTIYTFSAGKLLYDSNYFHEYSNYLQYNVRHLTHNPDKIVMNGITYMQIAGGSYTRKSNYYVTIAEGNITQQADTVITESPFQVSYYKNDHTFSYSPDPNPLYALAKPIYQGFLFSDRSSFGFENEQRSVMNTHNWSTKTWGYVGNNIISNSESYVFTFRPDGFPDQARKTSTFGTNPTKITKVIYMY